MSEENQNQEKPQEHVGKNGVSQQSANKSLIITGLVIAFFVLALITNGFGLFHKGGAAVVTDPTALAIGNAPVLGNENASVTIIEFSDFSCPYCSAADGHNPTVTSEFQSKDPNWQAPIPLIIDNYVNTGKAKLVFKYATGHGTGTQAQLVGWAMNDQGLFWQFDDAAFANQENTSSLDAMKEIAKSIGANMTKLDEDLNSNKYNYLLQADNAQATAAGVSGTPTFFVNGVKVEGAVSYAQFSKVIDSELAKVKK